MNNVLVLIISFLGGYLVKKTSSFDKSQVSLLNSFILYISLPSQIFMYIPKMNFNYNFWAPISVSWIIFLVSVFFFNIIGKKLNYNKKTIICLIMVCGLGNTSFVGLPLLENYFGQEGVGIGIYVDQFGTFLVLSLLGIPYLLFKTNENISTYSTIKKIILFPPFISIILAIFIKILNFNIPYPEVLKRLGDTLAPLALFSVGFQLTFSGLKGKSRILLFGLTFKLILAPLIIYILYIKLFSMNNLHGKVSVFEAGMGPMITSTLIVSEKNIESDLASVLLAFGIIFSFITSYLWFKIFLV
jgi:malate permease and related proteins